MAGTAPGLLSNFTFFGASPYSCLQRGGPLFCTFFSVPKTLTNPFFLPSRWPLFFKGGFTFGSPMFPPAPPKRQPKPWWGGGGKGPSFFPLTSACFLNFLPCKKVGRIIVAVCSTPPTWGGAREPFWFFPPQWPAAPGGPLTKPWGVHAMGALSWLPLASTLSPQRGFGGPPRVNGLGGLFLVVHGVWAALWFYPRNRLGFCLFFPLFSGRWVLNSKTFMGSNLNPTVPGGVGGGTPGGTSTPLLGPLQKYSFPRGLQGGGVWGCVRYGPPHKGILGGGLAPFPTLVPNLKKGPPFGFRGFLFLTPLCVSSKNPKHQCFWKTNGPSFSSGSKNPFHSFGARSVRSVSSFHLPGFQDSLLFFAGATVRPGGGVLVFRRLFAFG